MRLQVIFSLIISSWSFNQYAQESDFVVKVKASNCEFANNPLETISSTGFILKEQGKIKGVITALHAVCGCKDVNIVDANERLFYDLTIKAVDLDRDIALINSDNLSKQFANGLEFSELGVDEYKGKNVTTFGYPYGLKSQIDVKIARVRTENALETLQNLIPNSQQRDLAARNSPTLSIKVVNLEMELTEGFSGAPILYAGKVLAIANGGLDKGRTHLCWAVPVKDIKLIDVIIIKDKERYSRLKKLKPAEMIHNSTENEENSYNITNFTPVSQFLSLDVDEKIMKLKNKYGIFQIPYVNVKYTRSGSGDIREQFAQELGGFFNKQQIGRCVSSTAIMDIACLNNVISYHPKNEIFVKELIEILKMIIETDLLKLPDENESLYEVSICISSFPKFNSQGKVKL